MSTVIFAGTVLVFALSQPHATSSLDLVGFFAIPLYLSLVTVDQRSPLTMTGKRKANNFSPTEAARFNYSFPCSSGKTESVLLKVVGFQRLPYRLDFGSICSLVSFAG